MNIFTKAVHAGDRKKPGPQVPATTPIFTATTYFYDTTAQLDRVFGNEEAGYSYSRYDNPTNGALEELAAELENGHGALACASGMLAIQTAIQVALIDRPKRIVAARALYGATLNMLTKFFEPFGVETRFVDACDLDEVRSAVAEEKPGCVLLETISNPLLRVAQIDRIAEIAHGVNAALIVDNTFATPLLVRPLELGAHLVVHSATKYLAGHGDVLGGLIITDESHYPALRTLSRTAGPVMGPFEAYLTMRGIKTFPLRMERQCANACLIANALVSNPAIDRVHYTGNSNHPDATAIARLFPKSLYGAMISFEVKGAGRDEVFAFMDSLKLVVRGTSLGDVHTLILYPAMASHRDLAPKQRARLGIGDNLVRLSVGIEDPADILADIEQALVAIGN